MTVLFLLFFPFLSIFTVALNSAIQITKIVFKFYNFWPFFKTIFSKNVENKYHLQILQNFMKVIENFYEVLYLLFYFSQKNRQKVTPRPFDRKKDSFKFVNYSN